ncbi:hypothetical protein ACS0TY_018527 [Phlomoides rotata]
MGQEMAEPGPESWSSQTFGALDSIIEKKKGEIETLDRIDDALGLEEEDIIERNKIQAELKRYLLWKEEVMYLKVKIRWNNEGDINSKFFHGWINKKNKANGLEGLLIDDTWIESVVGVKGAVYNHFKEHFSSKSKIRIRMPEDIGLKIVDSKNSGYLCKDKT